MKIIDISGNVIIVDINGTIKICTPVNNDGKILLCDIVTSFESESEFKDAKLKYYESNSNNNNNNNNNNNPFETLNHATLGGSKPNRKYKERKQYIKPIKITTLWEYTDLHGNTKLVANIKPMANPEFGYTGFNVKLVDGVYMRGATANRLISNKLKNLK
jgi:hypothetical protein